MILFDTTLRESMLILDGGPDSELPEGSGGPILAGEEAVFIGTRIDVDGETRVVLASAVPTELEGLVEAYSGFISSAERVLRVVNVIGDEYVTIPVLSDGAVVRILLSDLEEPDLVLVIVETAAAQGTAMVAST